MERIAVTWAQSVPIVTRCWAIGILATSVSLSAGIINIMDIAFFPDAIWKKGQYWRLITAFFFFGELDLNFLYNMYRVVEQSKRLDEGFLTSWEYLWVMCVNMVLLVMYSSFFNIHAVLGPTLLDALLYYWGRKNPDQLVAIMGVFAFKACYTGYATIITSLLIQKRLTAFDFASIAVGHLLFYFEDVFGKVHGVNPLQAPWLWFQQPEPPMVAEDEPDAPRDELQPDPLAEDVHELID